ncbi:hypothetical protein [Simplicispira hankyongi]|uniref:hypothetical protein n=1 Tax=Simplicispira hankyongi TaxID=2315688 RepID=UPI0011C4702A|nr:hypothetical protein [Simplicispira hankyongi]
MSKLSISLFFFELIVLAMCLSAAHKFRKHSLVLLCVGLFMIVFTALLLSSFGITEMLVGFSNGAVTASKLKSELLLPTLFVSFSAGAIGANLIATAITERG